MIGCLTPSMPASHCPQLTTKRTGIAARVFSQLRSSMPSHHPRASKLLQGSMMHQLAPMLPSTMRDARQRM